MGGAVSATWNADADSPSGKGKSVVSDPIEGLDADKFFEALKADILKGGEQERITIETLPDGSILRKFKMEEEGKFACAKITFGKDEMISENFGADQTLKRLLNKQTLKAYRDPTVLEFWQDDSKSRRSGKLVAMQINTLLTDIGASATAKTDMDSILSSGEKSVVTDPITDGNISADGFIEWYKTTCLADGEAKDDGSVLKTSTLGFLGMGFTLYSKHFVGQPTGDGVKIISFGTDSTLSQVEMTVFLQVLKDPFRLEAWGEVEAARKSGEPQKAQIEGTLKPVFEKLAEEAAAAQ